MKKIFPFLILSIFLNAILYAQTPQAFNYQAVARNINGSVVANQFISVEISIRDSSPTANIVYQEIDTATTNQFGLFAIAIGKGQVQVGTFAGINWPTGNKYIQVGFDPTGGSNFINMGVSELLSVPYALFAQSTVPTVTHQIGDLYQGGIIVSVWDSAGIQHGLIASLTDIGTSQQWSNITTTLIGASAENYRDGKANTAAIIAQGATSGAAYLCATYNGGGFTDWYLPAYTELNLCYIYESIINNVLGDTNGFQSGAAYWSSTEGSGSTAWAENFGAGGSGANPKNFQSSVRAVRRY